MAGKVNDAAGPLTKAGPCCSVALSSGCPSPGRTRSLQAAGSSEGCFSPEKSPFLTVVCVVVTSGLSIVCMSKVSHRWDVEIKLVSRGPTPGTPVVSNFHFWESKHNFSKLMAPFTN